MAKTQKELFNTLEQESKKKYEEKNQTSTQGTEDGDTGQNQDVNKKSEGEDTGDQTQGNQQANKQSQEAGTESGSQSQEGGNKSQGQDTKSQKAEDSNQGKEGEQKQQEVDLSQIEESKLVDFLKNKTGVELNSLEDVKKIGAEPEEQFVSDEIKAINDFVKETNRTPQEYFEANKDWDKVAQDKPQDLAKQYLKEQYPDLDETDIQAELEEKYLPLEELDPEEHDETEVNKRKRENKKRQIELKKLVNQGKNHFNELKEKYKAPVKTQEQKEQDKILESDKEFGENMRKVLDNDIQDQLKFETDHGEFSHQLEDKDKLKNNLTSLEGVMDMFRDDSKQFNYKQFAETLIKGMKADDIVKNISTNVASKTKEETLNEINPGRQGNPPDRSGEQTEKTEAQKKTEQNLDHILGRSGTRKIK